MSEKWFDLIQILIAPVAAVTMLTVFFTYFMFTIIPSDSMLPTYQIDDVTVCYKTQEVEHGDVIIFYPFGKGGDLYIKRLIGLPGDTVEVKEGKLWVNGVAQDEDYLNEPVMTYTMPAVTVPEGQMFVMGDNRNYSADSHVFGCVPMENIIGVPIFKF